jgi:hypothetical protein
MCALCARGANVNKQWALRAPIAHKKRPMKYGEATCYQCFATLLATIYLPSEQCFLDDLNALYSIHAAAMESKGEMFQQWRASPPDALLRVVVDALRDPAPAAWRSFHPPVCVRALILPLGEFLDTIA